MTPSPAIQFPWGTAEGRTPHEVQQLSEAILQSRAELEDVPGFRDVRIHARLVDEIPEAEHVEGNVIARRIGPPGSRAPKRGWKRSAGSRSSSGSRRPRAP